MPKGPKGQKRPADVIGNAVKVMRIATGEEEEDIVDDGKDPAAKSLGSRGGKARAAALGKRQLPQRDGKKPRSPSRADHQTPCAQSGKCDWLKIKCARWREDNKDRGELFTAR